MYFTEYDTKKKTLHSNEWKLNQKQIKEKSNLTFQALSSEKQQACIWINERWIKKQTKAKSN